MAESIVTTLLQATKNDLEFYFCVIGDAWIRKQGASAVLLELEYQQSNVVHHAGNEQCGYGVEYANLGCPLY